MIIKTKLAAVAIPVYKSALTEAERLSFSQCLVILKDYEIYLVAPEGLDLSGYHSGNIKEKRFDPTYFQGIAGYNRLMLLPLFYQHFLEYEYILIYQLDCYVFRDELKDWCEQGYDYIGAPWIDMDIYRWLFIKNLYPVELKFFHWVTKGRRLNRVGNGGFSLRRTKSMIDNLNWFSFRAKSWKAFEDSFFCHYVATFNVLFKTPDIKTALRFSFDAHPKLAYEMNDHQLPFGCHAYSRNDPPYYTENFAFWGDHLEKENI